MPSNMRTIADEVLETAVEIALALPNEEHAGVLDDLRHAFPGESANDRFRERLIALATHLEHAVATIADGWDGLDWPLVMDDAGILLCTELTEAAERREDIDTAALAARIVRRAVESLNGDEADAPFSRNK